MVAPAVPFGADDVDVAGAPLQVSYGLALAEEAVAVVDRGDFEGGLLLQTARKLELHHRFVPEDHRSPQTAGGVAVGGGVGALHLGAFAVVDPQGSSRRKLETAQADAEAERAGGGDA